MKTRTILTVATMLYAAAGFVRAAAVPLPPWANAKGGPTGTVQVLKYIEQVKQLLPQAAQREIDAAEKPHGKLSVVYRESVKSRLYQPEGGGDTYALLKALAEIQNLLKLYQDQWQYLDQGGSAWRLDLSSSNAVGAAMAGLRSLRELQKRVDTPGDNLDGLTNYNALFDIPGAVFIAYSEMENCFWNGKRERGDNLIAFLLQDCNSNGFTKGNTYFWKGKTLNVWHDDLTGSVIAYMQTHKYPACLVYIAWSYFDAAQILLFLGRTDEAIALMSVEVPNVDSIGVHNMRHIQLADTLINTCDPTNAVRHLQASMLLTDANKFVLPVLMEGVRRGDEIWKAVLDKPIRPEEELARIAHGYKVAASDAVFGPDVRSALEHDWPPAAQIPVNVLTNRLLSNNIFEPKKRDLK